MRWLALVCALCACRWHFDPLDGVDSANAPKGVLYGKASNTAQGVQFGGTVAISEDGNTIAICSQLESSTGGAGSGAVYVFVRAGDSWIEQAYLKASNAELADLFGRSVTLSADGNTLAVGANGEDSLITGVNGDETNNSASASGAVYVFVRVGSTWMQQAYVKASNSDANDEFGTSVALSADGYVLAVGAMGEASASVGVGGSQTGNSANSAGAVYVFTRVGTTWSQQEYIKASNTESGDRFGEELALSDDGTTLAVSAPLEDSNGTPSDNSLSEAGAVYVFVYAGGWTQQAYVKADVVDLTTASGAIDQFGWNVALSADGNTLAIGARLESSAATLVNGDATDNSALSSGAAYIFTRDAGTWTQRAYIKAPNTRPDDFFGEVIDLSRAGDVLVVGAPNQDDIAADSGAVYVYRLIDGAWFYDFTLKAPMPGVGDQFSPVAISGNGATIVVGAPNEDGGATGIDGDQSDNSAPDAGAFYIFE